MNRKAKLLHGLYVGIRLLDEVVSALRAWAFRRYLIAEYGEAAAIDPLEKLQ